MHLCLTNITALTNSAVGYGSEGGQLLQLPNCNFMFFGSVGLSTKNKGRPYYSTCPAGQIGPFTNMLFQNEYPRQSFGQGTIVALTGSNKIIFERAIAFAASQTYSQPLAGASAAFSVRRLPGYTGPAMDVRRSSDNAVLRIGFTASGDLDTNSLLAFAGSSNALVATWYDQSGNGNNAVQITNVNQPVIVTNGALRVDQNGLPTILWGSPASLETATAAPMAGGFSAFAYAGRNWNTAAYAPVFETADYAVASGYAMLDSTGGAVLNWGNKAIIGPGFGYNANVNNQASSFGTPLGGFLNSTNNGVFYALEVITGSTNAGVWINGANNSTTIATGPATIIRTNIFIGGNPESTDYQDGSISELIIFPKAIQTTHQAAVRANIANYFTGPRPLQSLNLTVPQPVNTNWISGALYTNTTGRTIIVAGNVVDTPASVAGTCLMNLQCAGTGTNAQTLVTVIGMLTNPLTNGITPLVVTNGGVFTWTNLSSGAGNATTTSGGQYMVY